MQSVNTLIEKDARLTQVVNIQNQEKQSLIRFDQMNIDEDTKPKIKRQEELTSV